MFVIMFSFTEAKTPEINQKSCLKGLFWCQLLAPITIVKFLLTGLLDKLVAVEPGFDGRCIKIINVISSENIERNPHFHNCAGSNPSQEVCSEEHSFGNIVQVFFIFVSVSG